MNCLIVNADDFGYSFGINRGIIEAHTSGIVTSTSVMVDAIAASEAAELMQYPNLSVGLHFVAKNFSNVLTELEQQVAKFISIVGVLPDHIDSHKIYTTDTRLREVLLSYSKRHHIPVRGLGSVKFIDSFFGFHSNGDVSITRLKQALDQATEGYNEIMCHVGYVDEYLREHSSYSDPRKQELKSVCDPLLKPYLAARNLKLCNYKQLDARQIN